MRTGHRVHHRREEHHARLAEPVGGGVNAKPTRRQDEVGLVIDQRLEHHRYLGRIVLPIGIERDHIVGPELDAEPIADPQRHAVAEVRREHEGECAVLERDLCSSVCATVHDDQRDHRQPTRL